MSELKSAFSPEFNEAGFEARIDWSLSRKEFARSIERLIEEIKKHQAAIPLPVAASIGAASCLLAGIDCKGCPGLCCTRAGKYVSLTDAEARRLGIEGTPNSLGHIDMPLPCKSFKKGQCSVYADRPAHCRLYPVQAGGSGRGVAGHEAIIGLDSHCPEASRLALRVYMASYDMAHGVKDL
jgi:Fe-S-cluster containining protein